MVPQHAQPVMRPLQVPGMHPGSPQALGGYPAYGAPPPGAYMGGYPQQQGAQAYGAAPYGAQQQPYPQQQQQQAGYGMPPPPGYAPQPHMGAFGGAAPHAYVAPRGEKLTSSQ